VITVACNGANLTTGSQSLTVTASNTYGIGAGTSIQINYTATTGTYQIYQNYETYQPTGSAYGAKNEPATNPTNVGPSGNQYVCTIKWTAIWFSCRHSIA
jgi:hypothetical protein